MRVTSLAACLVLIPLAAAASAEEVERYRLEKSGDGYVRMDTRTGEMSTCAPRDGQLVCRAAADERAAFQDEIERLQEQLEQLDRRVGKLENSVTAKLESGLPTEEDFDKAMGYMERFLRYFMGVMKDIDKNDAAPNKT